MGKRKLHNPLSASTLMISPPSMRLAAGSRMPCWYFWMPYEGQGSQVPCTPSLGKAAQPAQPKSRRVVSVSWQFQPQQLRSFVSTTVPVPTATWSYLGKTLPVGCEPRSSLTRMGFWHSELRRKGSSRVKEGAAKKGAPHLAKRSRALCATACGPHEVPWALH